MAFGWLTRTRARRHRERATALVTEGVGHARERRFQEALRAYEAAIDHDDTLAVAHLNAGLCRLDLLAREGAELEPAAVADELAAAVACFERAVALDDASTVAWRALARAETRRHAWVRAEEAWRRAHALLAAAVVPDAAALKEAREASLALGRLAAAARARDRALAALASDAAEEERRAALEELTPFVDESDAGFVRDAGLARGHALVGTLARRLGDRVGARTSFERAVHADATDVEAQRELASLCIEEGDLARALTASVAAYRERPGDAGLVCNVGVCHLGLGDLERADEYIDLAFRLEPKDPIVLRAREALHHARKAREP